MQCALRLQTVQGRSVLDVDTAGLYRPVTRETRDAFEALLAFIREQYDDQPYDVLRGAAEEVLAVLKNEGLKVRMSLPPFLPFFPLSTLHFLAMLQPYAPRSNQ